MTRMYSNAEIPTRNYGDSSKLTNQILDSGATCQMTSDISDCIPNSLMETNKYIEVAHENFVTEKQTGQFQIEMRDENGKSFIGKFYDILLELDLCDQLFSIIALIN